MRSIKVTDYNMSARIDATGAIDADVTITLLDGSKIKGSVTLIPRDGDVSVLEWWGMPEQWAPGAISLAFYERRISLSDLREIVEAVREAVQS
ncbi:MAG: hypothetical protein ACHREM_00980 [Polyangiales bacterium]